MSAGDVALLEARGLHAGYGGLAAVRDLTLTVRPGEVVVLLGANGAGKTTTLLTLAGALPPLDGEVLLDGRPARGGLHQRVRQGLGLITDDRAVVMGMTVRDNLRLSGARLADVLAIFPELEPHVGRRVGLLSGGQQQMLSLGRALSTGPKLLLADELSLGLAPIVVQRLLEAVRRAADGGVGVLLVEQFARDALAIADRAYVMRRGSVVLEDDATALTARFDEVQQLYLSAAR